MRAQTDVDKTKEASAAPKDVAEKIEGKDKKERVEGWTKKVWLGGTFSFSSSSNVVGTTDGTSLQFGLILDTSLTLNRGVSTWENVLKVQESQSRTPAIDDYIKSLDNLDLQTTYYYHFENPPWLGPYGRLRLVTSLFPGYNLDDTTTQVRFLFLDGTEQLVDVIPGQRVDLTNSFEPTYVSENVGMFAWPVEGKDLNLKAKLGFGLLQVLAGDHAFAVKDDASTPELELAQIENANSGGGVVELSGDGKIKEDVTWKLESSFFYEFFSDSQQDLSLIVEVNGSIAVALAKWASIDYVLLVRRVPVVLDDWQVQNGLNLKIGFDLCLTSRGSRSGVMRMRVQRTVIGGVAIGCLLGAAVVRAGLDAATAAKGLTEALRVGIDNVVKKVGVTDGFLKNEAIKIPVPGHLEGLTGAAEKAGGSVAGEALGGLAKTAAAGGTEELTGKLVETMNRAAEAAAPLAKDVFLHSIDKLTYTDALAIVNGKEDEATQFLRKSSGEELKQAMLPIVSEKVESVGTLKAYNDLADKVKDAPGASMLEKAGVDTQQFNLNEYVTTKAVDGIFHVLGEEEAKIRKDPAARVSGILSSVFGSPGG